MVICSIRNCKNRSVKGGVLKFYSFPKNETMASAWFQYCKPKTKLKTGRVCSTHFVPSDYDRPLRHRLMNYSPSRCRTLKLDAVPSMHISEVADISYPKQEKEKILDDKDSNTNQNCMKQTKEVTQESSLSQIKQERLDDQETKLLCTDEDHLEQTKYQSSCLSQTGGESTYTNSSAYLTDHDYAVRTCILKRPCSTQMENRSSDHSYTKPKSNMASGEGSNPCDTNYDGEQTKELNKKISIQTQTAEIGDTMVSIPATEYQNLMESKEKYDTLYKNLQSIFTLGQIHSLHKLHNPSDTGAAIALRSTNPKAYRYMRDTLKISLPGYSTLRDWAAKFKFEIVEG